MVKHRHLELVRQRTMELRSDSALETTPGSMGEQAMELPVDDGVPCNYFVIQTNER